MIHDEQTPGWSRWAKRVSSYASAMDLCSPRMLDGLKDAYTKGVPPKSDVLRAGRWILVEWRRRTYYQLGTQDIPGFARL